MNMKTGIAVAIALVVVLGGIWFFGNGLSQDSVVDTEGITDESLLGAVSESDTEIEDAGIEAGI